LTETIDVVYCNHKQHEAHCAGLSLLQAALQACYENSGDLKEVHFVLFGSDTYDVWLAAASKHLNPVTADDDNAQQANADASASSPANSDEASPMQGTTSQDASPARNAAGSPQHSSALKDGSAREVAATDESSKEETSVQTLTGKQVHKHVAVAELRVTGNSCSRVCFAGYAFESLRGMLLA